MSDHPLVALLARVEAAEGPDRELDCRIAAAIDPGLMGEWRVVAPPTYAEPRYFSGQPGMDWIGYDLLNNSPPFTASLDTALALVERRLPGWMKFVGDLDPSDMRACATITHERPPTPGYRGFAPQGQYALALLAALLKALIAAHADTEPRGAHDPA